MIIRLIAHLSSAVRRLAHAMDRAGYPRTADRMCDAFYRTRNYLCRMTGVL